MPEPMTGCPQSCYLSIPLGCLQKSKCSFTRASFHCFSDLLLPSDKSCSSQSIRHHEIPIAWLQHLGPVCIFSLTCISQILPLELSMQGTWGKTLCRNNVMVVFLIPWGPSMCSEAVQHSHLTNSWVSQLTDFKSLLCPHCVELSNFFTSLHLYSPPPASKSYYENEMNCSWAVIWKTIRAIYDKWENVPGLCSVTSV